MLKKQDILNSTDGGLEVFRHYLKGDWQVGRNFKNPLYDDKNASCNIYKDKRSDTYKMKDFGDESFSGDCFFLVGYLHGLDCRNASDFVDILKIINRDLGLCLENKNIAHKTISQQATSFTENVEKAKNAEKIENGQEMVGSSSIITEDLSCPFLLMSFTIREL